MNAINRALRNRLVSSVGSHFLSNDKSHSGTTVVKFTRALHSVEIKFNARVCVSAPGGKRKMTLISSERSRVGLLTDTRKPVE